MAAKKQLTKTEKLGKRLHFYLLGGFIPIFSITAIFLMNADDHAKSLAQASLFLIGTFFLLLGIVGLKTKTAWLEIGFRYGKDAKFVSISNILLALMLYYFFFKMFN